MNLNDCLENNSIKKDFSIISNSEMALKLADEFLEEAEQILAIQKYRMAFISAYLANFHTCRALLYSLGYKEHSHFCLYVALGELLQSNKKLLVHINLFNKYREEREQAQYKGKDISFLQARNIIIDAKDFLKDTKEYLKK